MESTVKFTIIHCANCGIPFAITTDKESRLRECHNNFYCPNGHPQSFNGKSEAEILREKLDAKVKETLNLRQTIDWHESENTRLGRSLKVAKRKLAKK